MEVRTSEYSLQQDASSFIFTYISDPPNDVQFPTFPVIPAILASDTSQLQHWPRDN